MGEKKFKIIHKTPSKILCDSLQKNSKEFVTSNVFLMPASNIEYSLRIVYDEFPKLSKWLLNLITKLLKH